MLDVLQYICTPYICTESSYIHMHTYFHIKIFGIGYNMTAMISGEVEIFQITLGKKAKRPDLDLR